MVLLLIYFISSAIIYAICQFWKLNYSTIQYVV